MKIHHKTPSKIADPLRFWRNQHARESKIIAVLETDWPGTGELSRNTLAYVAQRIPDSGNNPPFLPVYSGTRRSQHGSG